MSWSFQGKFKTKEAAHKAVADAHAPGTIKGYVHDAITSERTPSETEVITIFAYGYLCRDAQDLNGTTASITVKVGLDPA